MTGHWKSSRDSAWHNKKRQRCIDSYSSKTKMKCVLDWRKRILVCGATQKQVADAVGITPPRISEYTRLLIEPTYEIFQKIEDAIRAFEKSA